jgi:acyl carrier protein
MLGIREHGSHAQPADGEIRFWVIRVIGEHFDLDRETISDSTRLVDELGLDSLDLVEIALAFEEEFNIDLSDEEAARASTVGEMVDLVKSHVNRNRHESDTEH